MGQILKELSGMSAMSDQVIAADFQLSVKSGIRAYASALSNAVTPYVRDVLKRHLDAAVNSQAMITNYMISKGYYQAYDPQKQFAMDIRASDSIFLQN